MNQIANAIAAPAGVTEDDRPVVLSVRDLMVTYGSGPSAVTALGGISFEVRRGEFACVVGPSGCGKTTLLRCLAGLMRPTSGEVVVDGRTVSGPPPGLAMVFQEYTRSLMPWLTVHGNVTFPLKAQGLAASEVDQRADKALVEVGLAAFGSKYPWQLSGGMQQRVAIARAVAYQPVVLLMDEPFAAVDAQTRSELEDLVLRVQRDTGMTFLFVTHDIDESVYLGHRVVVLSTRPTTVRRSVNVELPFPRDQVETKATREFVELRTTVSMLIRKERDAAEVSHTDRPRN